MRLRDYFFDTRLQVGLQAQIAPALQHGLVSMRNAAGEMLRFGLVVNYPDRLVNHCTTAIEEVFNQIDKFGGIPVQLEIKLNNIRRVYAYGNSKPILTEPIT